MSHRVDIGRYFRLTGKELERRGEDRRAGRREEIRGEETGEETREETMIHSQ